MSNVESNDVWPGKMPSDWQRSRLRNVAALSPGYSATVPASDEQCTVVPMELLSGDGAIDATNQQPFVRQKLNKGLSPFDIKGRAVMPHPVRLHARLEGIPKLLGRFNLL
jgi:hypothetical protein